MSFRLLITDDDPCLQGLYHSLFGRRAELEVDYAMSPAACRAYLARGRYDMALLDISLGDPDEDGLELLRLVRETSPQTSVVMMSSMDSPDLVDRCLSLGAGAFTSKNRDFAARLRRRVGAYLRLKGTAAAS
jgi:DNA-binding response OmpR family regulator